MIGFHLWRNRRGDARYYRVDVAYNLFGEYSVLREWGQRGKIGVGAGRSTVTWFSNLRDACLAAERWQKRARRRGYNPLLQD